MQRIQALINHLRKTTKLNVGPKDIKVDGLIFRVVLNHATSQYHISNCAFDLSTINNISPREYREEVDGVTYYIYPTAE